MSVGGFGDSCHMFPHLSLAYYLCCVFLCPLFRVAFSCVAVSRGEVGSHLLPCWCVPLAVYVTTLRCCVACGVADASERAESFLDVQLMVKNLKSVEESLQSMIAGEILNGDNRYGLVGLFLLSLCAS